MMNNKNILYKGLRFPMVLAVFLFLAIGIPSVISAQDIPPRPDPPRLVNDIAGLLQDDQVYLLEQKLVAFNDSTSTQIVLLIVNDLAGYDKSQFAYEVGQSWGVGQKGKDNGVVMLIKPKTSSSRGEAFIAPGYGLEGAIPDAVVKRIIENEMIPRFRQNDYFGGIQAGLSVVMSLATGEYSADQYKKKSEKKPGWGLLIVIGVIILLIFLFRNNNNKHMHLGKDLPFWTLLMMASSMGGGRSGGSWGGGGGFGGFGGGGFGGGGAGGSW